MRALLIVGFVALSGVMNFLASDSTMQKTEVFPETTTSRQGSNSTDLVEPGRFQASLASLSKEMTKVRPEYTEGSPIIATTGERQCKDGWCTSQIEMNAEAFRNWEGLCSKDELLDYHYGCPIEVTFTIGGVAHQGSVFLKPGEKPTVDWASSGAPDGTQGVFAIAGTPL